MKNIEKYYDEKYDEWERLNIHKLEFDITKRYLDMYIKDDSLKIFDIGGGPGRYSIHLAKKGHDVSLLDLSSKNIAEAREKTEELGIQLRDYIHGNALNLGSYDRDYDVVLLMGPLYHLVKEEDRVECVKQALDRLKPGGLIVTSFISNYAPILDYLKGLHEPENIEDLLKYVKNGVNDNPIAFTTAYFSSSDEAMDLMNSFSLEKLAFAGVESALISKEKELNELGQEAYEKWLDISFALSQDSKLLGTSEHYLYIGRKPIYE